VVVVVVVALKKLTRRKVRVAAFFVKPGFGGCPAAVHGARRPDEAVSGAVLLARHTRTASHSVSRSGVRRAPMARA
jgi:hypothetical protein